MATLDLIPQSWLSWNFTGKSKQGKAADLSFNFFNSGGAITTNEGRYEIRRETGLVGDWLLELQGREIARIKKPAMMGRRFAVSWINGALDVRPQSALSRSYMVLADVGEVGLVAPRHFGGRRAAASFPDSVPFAVQVFVAWMVILLWRRAAGAAAGGA